MHTAICWSILFKHWSLIGPRTAVEGRAAFTGCPGSPSTVSPEPRLLTDGLRGFRGRPGDSQGRPGFPGHGSEPGGPYPTRGRQDIRGVPGSHISLPEVERRGPDLCTHYRSCFQCFQRDLTTLNIL